MILSKIGIAIVILPNITRPALQKFYVLIIEEYNSRGHKTVSTVTQ